MPRPDCVRYCECDMILSPGSEVISDEAELETKIIKFPTPLKGGSAMDRRF